MGDWCIDHAVDQEEEDGVEGLPEGTNMTNVCPCEDKDLCQVQCKPDIPGSSDKRLTGNGEKLT